MEDAGHPWRDGGRREAGHAGDGAAAVGDSLGRDGFYLHGRGRHGSDGCIVPMEKFSELMTALEKDRGGVLFVLEAMGGDRFV